MRFQERTAMLQEEGPRWSSGPLGKLGGQEARGATSMESTFTFQLGGFSGLRYEKKNLFDMFLLTLVSRETFSFQGLGDLS